MNIDFYKSNYLGLILIETLEKISEDELYNKMEKVYKQCCTLEELKYFTAYGFGKEAIKEYIVSTVLLDFIQEKDKIYIEGAIRLLIIGEFGPLNFSDFLDYLALKKFNINEESWGKILDIINEKFKTCVYCKLSQMRTKESQYVDMEEYIYILENVDVTKKFRRDKGYEDLNNEFEENDFSKNSVDKEKHKKENNKYFIKVGIAFVVIFCIIGGGIIALNTFNKNESKESVSSTNRNNTESNDKVQSNNQTSSDDSSNNNATVALGSYEKVNYDTATMYYCVYAGAFTEKSNAYDEYNTLINKNIEATIIEEDTFYKVRIGSTYTLEEAKEIYDVFDDICEGTYFLAYDKDVEAEIEYLAPLTNGIMSYDEFYEGYYKLREEIQDKPGYERYLKQIDELYQSTEGNA